MEKQITVLISDTGDKLSEQFTEYIRNCPIVQQVQVEDRSADCTGVKRPVSAKYDLESVVTQIIRHLNVPANIKGYQYLRTAIMMSVENMELMSSITKRLYPEIARIYSSNISGVESAIRHAVESAWNRCPAEILDEYFGVAACSGMDRPTNSEFIAVLADRIRLEQKNKHIGFIL